MKEAVTITIVGIIGGIFAPYYTARFMCYLDIVTVTCDDPVILQWIGGFLALILLAFACAAFAAITAGVIDSFKKITK